MRINKLSPSEFFVDGDIKRAKSLPREAFTGNDFLERELCTVFAKSWLFLAPEVQGRILHDPRLLCSQTEIRGSFTTCNFLDNPICLLRDFDGKLRCFSNACSHRGYPVLEGYGTLQTPKKTLTCGQHGREFDCAGCFVSHRGFQGTKNFPGEEDNLHSFPLYKWAKFFFVALGEPIAPPEIFFKKMLERSPVETEESVCNLMNSRDWPLGFPELPTVREVDGNWKIHALNYLDASHIKFIHRAPHGLADAIDLKSYQTEIYDFSCLQLAYATNPEMGFVPKHTNGRSIFALWWFIFPNLALNFYPWGLSINMYMPISGKPDKTKFVWFHYVSDKKKYEDRNTLWQSDDVDREDVSAIKKVNAALKSRFFPRARYAAQEERTMHWFERRIYEMVFNY